MKILIFSEGTALMPASARNMSREERVRQSASESDDTKHFRSYIPNGNAVAKITEWKKQGAEIYYLTSRTSPKEINDILFVLSSYKFPDAQNLMFRIDSQQYKDVAEGLMPDIFIEDDCESIGGVAEMTYPHIHPDFQKKIHSIIVKEFEGINHVPDTIADLTIF